jgi:hypothetical protein
MRALLIRLPKLKQLRLERVEVGRLDEVERLCVEFSGTLRRVEVSLTGVLSAHEAKKVKGGRIMKEGKEGDVARRRFSAEVRERVWLQSGARVTLQLDVEGVHGSYK